MDKYTDKTLTCVVSAKRTILNKAVPCFEEGYVRMRHDFSPTTVITLLPVPNVLIGKPIYMLDTHILHHRLGFNISVFHFICS